MATEIITSIVICQFCINKGQIMLSIDPKSSEIPLSNICKKCKKLLSDFNDFNNRCIRLLNIANFQKLSEPKLLDLFHHRVVKN